MAGCARVNGFRLNTELIVRSCHRYFLVTAELRVSESGAWDDGLSGQHRSHVREEKSTSRNYLAHHISLTSSSEKSLVLQDQLACCTANIKAQCCRFLALSPPHSIIMADIPIPVGTPVLAYISVIFLVLILIYLRFFYVDFSLIRNIPEIPGGSLLHGHLYMLGQDHATTAEKWSQDYGWPIYQARLGNRRVIFLNGFEVAREWLVTRQSYTIDRPSLYTFHNLVSKTSGMADRTFCTAAESLLKYSLDHWDESLG